MMHPMLQRQLTDVFNRRRQIRLGLTLALYWSAMAALVIFLIIVLGSAESLIWLFVLSLLGVGGMALLVNRERRKQPDWKALAQQIEIQHPELNGLLITAVQQDSTEDGQLHYLQRRVVEQAVLHGHINSWGKEIPSWRIAAAQCAHMLALVLFVAVLVGLTFTGKRKSVIGRIWTADSVTVTPGDVSIERGERLVVMASFTGSVPANSDLVIASSTGQPKRIPLAKSLSDPVFGGSISDVTNDFTYHVEYNGKRTPDFAVKVFELPRLERADADLTYPAYTGLEPKRIENTHRVSAVEGTRANLTLQLNKPVAKAQFILKDQPSNTVPLVVVSNEPTLTLAGLPFETNRTYLLQLVDADGRTNRLPAQFVIDVLKNREPELKVTSPRGDTRPSALEEITFSGTVWDDFGAKAYGLAYAQGGGEIKFVELGRGTGANEKRPFNHTLRLEDLGVKPEELISWFVWADDIGPDGKVRRSVGDMYFAEVRPFDELFRQGQGQGGGGEQQQEGSEGGGSAQSKLTQLQKQIINATWKLKRQQPPQPPTAPKAKPTEGATMIESSRTRPTAFSPITTSRSVFGQRASGNASPPQPSRTRNSLSSTNKTSSGSQYVDDLNVVRDAVAQGISQAEAARDQESSPAESALWDTVIREMEKAKAALDKAANSTPSLSEALAAEQAAFQALLKLQQREYQVSRNRNRSQQSSSSRDEQTQRQLDQLDLTNPENRYENERLAQAPQNAQRREQLQVMNRLSELARRQQDVNERLKELQTALQAAKTEQEREELRRQLKRLEEEEQRMLADADELQQQMNQPENQARMSEERQQLEQARQEMQRSAESAQQGSPSQALASGTRAQRQLQEMRENMRKQNSSEFAEDLKQLRNEAREAERRQQEIQKQMDNAPGGGAKSLDDSKERQQALEQLAQQAQRLTNLVERATQLSQQTEEAEPLASRELYDSLRKFSQEDAKSVRDFQDELIQSGLMRTELYRRLGQLAKEDSAKSVELTSELLRQGLLPQAQQAGGRASAAVSEFKRGIERATEKVLGDDTEALRLAQQQLDELTKQIEREVAQGQGQGAGDTNGVAKASGRASQSATNAPGLSGAAANADQRQAQAGNEHGRQAGQRQGAGMTNGPSGENAGALASSTNRLSRDGQTASSEQRQTEAGNRNQKSQPEESSQSQSGSQASENAQTEPGQNGEGNGQGQPTDSAQNGQGNQGGREGSAQSGRNGNRGVPRGLEQFLQGNGRGGNDGRNGRGAVITGEDYGPWSNGLREIEEMVDDTSQQSQLATVRERARLMRQEYNRTRQSPDWDNVRSQVLKPLVEVRSQIAEELARRGSRENLVPIDRDPVPTRYSESVRRYYEELGKDK